MVLHSRFLPRFSALSARKVAPRTSLSSWRPSILWIPKRSTWPHRRTDPNKSPKHIYWDNGTEIYGKSSGNPWGGCQWLEINPMIWVLVEVQGNSDYDLQLRSLLDGTADGILRWHAWTGGWWHSMGISAKAGGIQRSKDQSSEHISGIKPKKNLRGVDMEPNMLLFQHFQPRSCTIFVGGFRLRGSNA